MVSQSGIFGQSWPKIAFFGKNREIKENWEIKKKIEKRQFQQVSVIKMNFDQEKTIFTKLDDFY